MERVLEAVRRARDYLRFGQVLGELCDAIAALQQASPRHGSTGLARLRSAECTAGTGEQASALPDLGPRVPERVRSRNPERPAAGCGTATALAQGARALREAPGASCKTPAQQPRGGSAAARLPLEVQDACTVQVHRAGRRRNNRGGSGVASSAGAAGPGGLYRP